MLHMSNQYDVIEQKQYFRFEHNNFIKHLTIASRIPY